MNYSNKEKEALARLPETLKRAAKVNREIEAKKGKRPDYGKISVDALNRKFKDEK